MNRSHWNWCGNRNVNSDKNRTFQRNIAKISRIVFTDVGAWLIGTCRSGPLEGEERNPFSSVILVVTILPSGLA